MDNFKPYENQNPSPELQIPVVISAEMHLASLSFGGIQETSHEIPTLAKREPKPYIPPVGPGSKSVPPVGDYRDLPPGLIPKHPRKK